jgi:hypothetical protein
MVVELVCLAIVDFLLIFSAEPHYPQYSCNTGIVTLKGQSTFDVQKDKGQRTLESLRRLAVRKSVMIGTVHM